MSVALRGARAALVPLLLTMVGCAGLQRVSSGQVGCPPSEVVVTDHQQGWFGPSTWTATCHGKAYHCSGHGGGEGSTPQVSCSPAHELNGPPELEPAAAPAGCQYDTQCKGDRICVEGACVDPPPSSPPAAAPAPAAPDAAATPGEGPTTTTDPPPAQPAAAVQRPGPA